ncbi:Myb-like DNA-binding domain-containing protein [Cladophialophora immunda]|nr:Myb-like DNA-binding domain-containing protein [Cladophialophora immunda]
MIAPNGLVVIATSQLPIGRSQQREILELMWAESAQPLQFDPEGTHANRFPQPLLVPQNLHRHTTLPQGAGVLAAAGEEGIGSEAEAGVLSYERRDYERSREREARPRDSREHDVWPRDQSPARISAANPAAAVATPSAAVNDRPGKPDFDPGRRPSVVATPSSALRETRRDGEGADYFGSSRLDTSRRDAPQPPQQSPNPIGLDYGPPPSLPSVATPAAEKTPMAKPQPIKSEQVTPSPATFQPPSGPKASRTAPAAGLSQSVKTPQHQEMWARTEPASRPVRPGLTPSASNLSMEGSAKKDELPIESKPPAAPAADRSMPPNVPSGPRLGNTTSYNKHRLSSSEPAGSGPPPMAPREPSKPSVLDNRSPAIPTGPRSDREGTRTGPGTASKIWVSPDYKSKPSIMNAMNKQFQPEARDRGLIPTGPRQQNAFTAHPEKTRVLHTSAGSPPSAPSGPKALIATSPKIQDAKMTLLPPRNRADGPQHQEDVVMSVPASSEDEDEAEDDSFDEEYFAESEERHKQEMELLEAKKPPSLLQDTVAVALLVKLQFLHMIAQDSMPRHVPTPVEVTKEETPVAVTIPTGLPSPKQASEETEPKEEISEVEPPYPKGRPLKQPPVNPIPTPPIEDLPYLKSGPIEPVVFEESDNEVEHEAVSILLQQEFERNAWDWRSELEEMHAEFKARYPLWKQKIHQLEQERRELQASPAPASPAPSAAPSVTPSLTHERTRGARNTTEADLQAAILMSQQSLKEEEERREREAASSSKPNYDTEAVVPPMLKPAEIEISQFEETNHLIPNELALHAFAYVPPVDDFTEEEQTLFIAAYCQNPKKWGKIAESLPGRTYQECIVHYYLTKVQANYKDLWRRSQPRKRGRRGAATKPRSTALMSELLNGDDAEATPVAVTDSGRPRRAAAPTFGDAPSEADSSTPVPQSKKLTAALKDGNSDGSGAKTSRGRKAGAATKVRRTKAQIQAEQLQATPLAAAEGSPTKPVTAAKPERGRPLVRAENVPIMPDPTPPIPPVQRPVEAPLQPYPTCDVPVGTSAASASNASSQVTSYWSVPEQHKFPELLSYFGRDFTAIADFMKTKSVQMIKNYYSRQINEGKDEFEKRALMGEQMRLTGKVAIPPPSPIVPPKRRYDTALAPITRPATHSEQNVMDGEPAVAAIKQSVIEDFPRNILERVASGDIAAQPRPVVRETIREAPLSVPLPLKTEELPRLPNERASLFSHKPLHGPKAGVFQDDVGFQPARQNLRAPLQERSPQILSQRLPDMSRPELSQQTPMSATGPSPLGPREPLIPTQQRPPAPPAAPVQAIQAHVEKYSQPSALHPSHSRNSSSAAPSHQPLETPHDMTALRRLDTQRSLYRTGPTGSPALTPVPITASQPPRSEISQPAPAPPAEPPKAPAKRSNVFGLLNDDPEPPPKRPSLEPSKRTSILSPQITPLPSGQNLLQQPRSQHHPEDSLLNRAARGPYIPGSSNIHSVGGGQQSSGDYPSSYAATPATGPSNEAWMDRFDPRPQGAPSDQRSHHHSPAPSPYSVIPPTSQQSSIPPLHSLRVDTPRAPERPGIDHRRTLLGQINQIPHVPSPPPQQPTQPVPQLRSASTSSHHSRAPSAGYSASQPTSQSSSLGHSTVPQNHSHSASSTPVPSLHHRPQSSLDFPTRLTIQQHMAQQNQQKQQEQQREHERQIQRHRELEAAQQREREREREQQQQQQQPQAQQQQQQQQQSRRDFYGIEHHATPPTSRSNQLGAAANQSHMTFAPREIPRTYTPPHTHVVVPGAWERLILFSIRIHIRTSITNTNINTNINISISTSINTSTKRARFHISSRKGLVNRRLICITLTLLNRKYCSLDRRGIFEQ